MGVVRTIWPWLLALLAGVMLAMCHSPYDLPVMVWLGLVPLLVAVWAGGGKRRKLFGFGAGYLAGLSFWLINLKWLSEVGDLGWYAVSFFLALYFALWGLFAAGAGNPWRALKKVSRDPESGIAGKVRQRMAGKRDHRGKSWRESRRVLMFAAVNAGLWCGLEWVRGWFLTGFGWNGLGVSFHDQPVLAQSADLVGVTGLAFLPVFVMAVIVQVGRGLGKEVRSGRLRAHWDFGFAMLLMTACFLYGIWKLHGEPPPRVVPLRVLLVQLNIPQEAARKLWTDEEIYRGYEQETRDALEGLQRRNEDRVREAAEAGSTDPVILDVPEWIVWPEASVPGWLNFTEDGEQSLWPATNALLEAVNPRQQYTMVFGLPECEAERTTPAAPLTRKERGRSYNSILALPAGETSYLTYRKQHLVLFGETIPYVDKIPFLQKLWEYSAGTQYQGSFAAGEQVELIRVPHGPSTKGELTLVPTVCFEDTVARKMRPHVKKGGQLIVNVTNDGWFKESEAAAQHFANAKFRSIEFRRPTVRCANTGVSAVINRYGTVLDRKKGGRQVVENESGSHLSRGWCYATAYVPEDAPLTLYARFGDWFAAVGLVVAVGWGLNRRRTSRIEAGARQES